mmetsp:Transcript_10182/g.19554  ORF Transcript_10182/g.19554 Transcript_10182/m.19554 type:complete len:256 (-) Transcript_10182:344-1111(-)
MLVGGRVYKLRSRQHARPRHCSLHGRFRFLLQLCVHRAPFSIRCMISELKEAIFSILKAINVRFHRVFQHRRRAAEQHDRVVSWAGHLLCDHLLVDEPFAILPAFGCLVKRVPEVESLSCRFCPLLGILELLANENVVLGFVGEEQVQLRHILRILQDFVDDLKHRRDTGASGNHPNGFSFHPLSTKIEDSFPGVVNLAEWAPHVDRIPNLKLVDMLGHDSSLGKPLTRFVNLDDELHVALCTHAIAGWGVCPRL